MSKKDFRLRHNLATILRQLGMTASELSRKTGVAKQVLSDWMAGVQPRKIEHLYSVAKTLGITIENLCFAEINNPATLKVFDSELNTTENSFQDIQEIKGRFEVFLKRIPE